jgi:hypothetical protein
MTTASINSLASDIHALRETNSVRRGLRIGEQALEIAATCTVRVNGDFACFYRDGLMVGTVDKLTFFPVSGLTATPSETFCEYDAAAFETAMRHRIMDNAQARQRGEA